MKKALIVFSLLVFSVTVFSSCKKKYRCVCEEGKVVNSYLDKLSKSEAEVEKEKCEVTVGCTFERDK